ncbi:hypothetical protein [Vibrio sp. RE88]|uniref:hypothetical protein n=1 Tax=Vibrio sp. RE88 TaxID=2607610 RepID=UPI0014932D13|nr:hypothetical protein [Vibrio sp. RE88]NOH60504.1 hypothetical protein [Vibrio sp. RE88]
MKRVLLSSMLLISLTSESKEYLTYINPEIKSDLIEDVNRQTARSIFETRENTNGVSSMYLKEIIYNNETRALPSYIIEAEDIIEAKEIANQTFDLEGNLSRHISIVPLGSGWINSDSLALQSYNIQFTWNSDSSPEVVNNILGIDLQHVVYLSRKGIVTDSYIDSQTFYVGADLPVFSLIVKSQDMESAENLAKSFAMVNQGYASTNVKKIGIRN